MGEVGFEVVVTYACNPAHEHFLGEAAIALVLGHRSLGLDIAPVNVVLPRLQKSLCVGVIDKCDEGKGLALHGVDVGQLAPLATVGLEGFAGGLERDASEENLTRDKLRDNASELDVGKG